MADVTTTGDSWLTESRKESKLLFSELDVLLRALDRYFIQENHPASREPFGQKNLHMELTAARDVILRILSILDLIIPESNRNAYWFQKFAQNKLLDNRRRDKVRSGMYNQDSPEKSLYVLYDSFVNLKGLVNDILNNQHIAFSSFSNIGQMVGKELRENEFFNPFKLDIDPEYDIIHNKEIKDIVFSLGDKETKKISSILFLHLFRLLRYLHHMDYKSLRFIQIHASIIIFTLLKNEMEVFRTYVSKISGRLKDAELAMLLSGLSYQFSMESKRVFQQELKDILEKDSPVQLRGKIENSRGILKNLIEQTIIQLARYWNPNIKGERIFEFFVNRTSQSVKLREDIYVLNRLLAEIQRNAEVEDSNPDAIKKSFGILMNYMDYFEDFSFKLIRYDDFEEFSRLFYDLRNTYNSDCELPKVMESAHHFSVFLDTTLRQVENRAELKNRPLDVDKMEDFVRQYLT